MKTKLALLLALALLAGCDSKPSRSSGSGPQYTGPIRVLAISPLLPPEARRDAEAQIDTEVNWLTYDASPGSTTFVFDALECRQVAILRAVEGAPLIRSQKLKGADGKSGPAAAVRRFLNPLPRAGQVNNSSVRLPQLAQVLAQLHLPPGSAVVVFGSPHFVGRGNDEMFSTDRGYVPTDGYLFRDRRLSIYSTVGREHALSGLLFHLGYPTDQGIWVNDSHKQGVERFWSVYFLSQGATLVSFQPSLAGVAKAARDGERKPYMSAQPDPNAEVRMVLFTNGGGSKATNGKHPGDSKKKSDGILDGQTVMLVTFDHNDDVERSPLAGALEDAGAKVDRIRYPLPQLPAWRAALERVDQVWLISSGENDHFSAGHRDALLDRWRKGELGIYLGGGSTSSQEANAILRKIESGAELTPKGRGPRQASASGDGHRTLGNASALLLDGLSGIPEGRSAAEIRGAGANPLCRDSGGVVLIGSIERDGCGRILVDGGCTRWNVRSWDSAGAPRLATNIAGWLAGVTTANGQLLLAR